MERVIYLEWLKKFLQRFTHDEQGINKINYKNTPQQTYESLNSTNSDIEARIHYQYPKGRFRFPVIPDEKKRTSEGLQRNRTSTEKRPQASLKRKTKNETGNRQSNSEQLQRRATEKERYYDRPFKPTDIPSPIYGFDARRRASEPIEFSLSDFSKEQPKQKNPQQTQIINDEFERASRKSVSSEPAPSIIIERETVDVLPEPELPENETVSNAPDSLPIEKEESAPVVTEKNVTKTEPAKNNDEQTVFLQKNDREKKKSGKKEAVFVNKQHTLKDRAHNKIRKENKSSHIPFNVIMLSQDKKKFEEKTKEETHTHSPASQALSPDKSKSLYETAAFVEGEKSIENVVNAAPPKNNSKNKSKLQTQQNNTYKTAGTTQTEKHGFTGEPYYVFPSISLLKPPVFQRINTEWMEEQKCRLNETLKNFNVRAKVVNMTQGPSVTRFEVHPEPGVKVNKITNLSDDIKLSLAAKDIRIEAPIPGKHTIGIEVPNESRRPVFISEIIDNPIFWETSSPLAAVLGLDISGKPIVTDLREMPHGLIAGATGSGKSVCINSVLVSLLYKANPADVKLLLIDPKMVELAPYNRIPHLVSPVITDVKAATAALKWAVEEMEHRYELFAQSGVRDITRYNDMALKEQRMSEKLPYIVIVIDELADLMMVSPADVEEAICRIAQKARACGIHLIIATQRPSVDVITGLIKANVPTRIAFSVSSQVDSRTIIDISGAERLLGKGDMLFLENGTSKAVRLQGTFVTDEEIDEVVAHVRREQTPQYLFEQEELLKKELDTEEDDLFYDACEFIIQNGSASTSSLQRRFKIGYNRAARLIDMMEAQGFISESKGSKPRDVMITEAEFRSMKDNSSYKTTSL